MRAIDLVRFIIFVYLTYMYRYICMYFLFYFTFLKIIKYESFLLPVKAVVSQELIISWCFINLIYKN